MSNNRMLTSSYTTKKCLSQPKFYFWKEFEKLYTENLSLQFSVPFSRAWNLHSDSETEDELKTVSSSSSSS